MVQAGYSHSFCTPHIWPNLPDNTIAGIARSVISLQQELNRANIPLRLIPGGELSLRPDIMETPADQVPSYGMAGRYCLFDIWVDRIPAFFWKAVEWLQFLNLKVILAHPERMRAVQNDPDIADEFAERPLSRAISNASATLPTQILGKLPSDTSRKTTISCLAPTCTTWPAYPSE